MPEQPPDDARDERAPAPTVLPPPAPQAPRGRPPLPLLLAAALAVALVVAGVVLAHKSGSSSAGAPASPRASVAPDLPVRATGTDYTDAAGVARALPRLLAPAADAGTAAPSPDPLARLHDPAQLAGCLGQLTGPDSSALPLALDYARYRGQPALVVVLPSARPDRVDVFVVGAGCTAGDDRTLLFTRQPRP